MLTRQTGKSRSPRLRRRPRLRMPSPNCGAEPRPTTKAIARRLVLTERTVEGHVRSVLTKLDLPASEDAHQRVLAVIAYVGADDRAR